MKTNMGIENKKKTQKYKQTKSWSYPSMVNSTDILPSTFNVFPLAPLIIKKSGPYNLALAYTVLEMNSWFIIHNSH